MENVSPLSILFGAVVIAIFARKRFDTASFETEIGLKRLADLLTPSAMRGPATVRLSFLIYLLLLLTTYTAICLYARLLPPEVLQLFGNGGAQLGATGLEGAPEPGSPIASFPIWVALAFVGLIPSFSYLERGETWLRERTHRLVGIPTRVLQNAHVLQRTGGAACKALTDFDKIASSTLKPDDARLLETIAALPEARSQDNLIISLRLCAAISAWVFEDRADLDNSPIRRNFAPLERRLQARKKQLFDALADGTGLGDGLDADGTPALPSSAPAFWDMMTAQADDLAHDIRLYLAILVERGVLPATRHALEGTIASTAQKELAAYLSEIVPENIELPAERILMTSLSWCFWVVLVVGLVWGAVMVGVELRLTYPTSPARWDSTLPDRMTSLTLTLVLAYCVPVIVIMSFWFARVEGEAFDQNHTETRAKSHWTQWLPRHLPPVLLGWLGSCTLLASLGILRAVLAGQDMRLDNQLLERISVLMQYNAPVALRGACLGLILSVLLDRLYKVRGTGGREIGARFTCRTTLCCGLLMALIGAASRAMMIYWSMARQGSSSAQMRPEDGGIIVYAALQAALIGGLVSWCIISALLAPAQKPSKAAPA